VTFVQFMTNRRIQHGARLLHMTDMTVSTISNDCDDTRRFKSVMNVPPRQYRQRTTSDAPVRAAPIHPRSTAPTAQTATGKRSVEVPLHWALEVFAMVASEAGTTRRKQPPLLTPLPWEVSFPLVPA